MSVWKKSFALKYFIIPIFCSLSFFWVTACNSQITTVNSTNTPAPQFSASKKTSLEVYRNGKVYEILIGYSMESAPFYSTPVGEVPKAWSENYVDGAHIEVYSDFDNDGEMEILVSAVGCGANCSHWLMVYKYDPINDTYFVSDTIWGRLREYADFNKDGKPEFTLYFSFR